MERLKKSFFLARREQRKEVGNSDDVCMPDYCDSESRAFGLFVLHPLSTDAAATLSNIDVDIVAVHGLNGNAKKTWTDPGSGICWLEHFLPDALPRARIMTFGYDSRLAFSRSRAGLDSFARDLLNRLRMVRVGSEAEHRPLIFVAHSLGGIVVKKAIVLAHETATQYGPILASTTGIAFLGTPHRGSGLASWAALLANVINSFTLGHRIRNDLLRNLSQNSDVLRDISRQFVHRAAPLKIWTFVEQQLETPLKALVVPDDAAVLDLPNEMVVPLNTHHRGICRFSSRDSNYVLLEAAIMEMAYQGSKPHATNISGVIESTRPTKASWPTETVLSSRAPCEISEPTSAERVSPQNSLKHSTLSARLISPPEMQVRDNPGPILSEKSFSRPVLFEICVSGLTNKLSVKSYGSGSFSHTMQVPPDATVENLKDRLLEAHPDLKHWKYFRFPGCDREIDFFWTDVFTTAVEVTNGRSIYDLASGHLKINQEQTIASFFSEVFPHPVKANPYCQTEEDGAGAFSNTLPRKIAIGQGEEPDLLISFMRTVRIPEDGNEYDLPPNAGLFPIFDVRHFDSQLPVSMVAKGGLCIPMHEMEAMRIHFDLKSRVRGRSFAVRPYVGGVNGISGKPAMGGVPTSQLSSISERQDYIVLPDQEWLSGIATAPGLVRQFVAAKMAPSRLKGLHPPRSTTPSGEEDRADPQDTSYRSDNDLAGSTVEWQITGEDKYGGIQLQLIPNFDVSKMSATSDRDVCVDPDRSLKLRAFPWRNLSTAAIYDTLKTPKELGLRVGSVIHIKDMADYQSARPKIITDLFRESPANVEVGDVIELEIHDDKRRRKWKFNIRKQNGTGGVVSLWFMSDDKFNEILAVVRHRFSEPESSLLMDGVLPNEPMTAINSWEDLEVVLSAATRPGQHRYSQIRKFGLWTEADVVVGDARHSEPLGLCIVHYGDHEPKFGDDQEICLVLGQKTTVRDLRQVLEDTTGKSTAAYVIKNEELIQLDGIDPVFDKIPSETPPRRHLRIAYNHGPQTIVIKVLYDRRTNPTENRGDIKVSFGTHEVSFKVNTRTRVSKLYRAIEPYMGCKIFTLMFNGERMSNDGLPLGSYELVDGDVIEAFQVMAGGGPGSLLVRYNSLERHVPLDFLMTIESVKVSIATWIDVPKDLQMLSYQGKALDNGDHALKYGHKVLDLTLLHTGPPAALGIGAGGTIWQNIKRDTNNPRTWDLANAKLLNVQILDSATFGLVTGLDPPRAPMPEKVGVAGDWASLLGVAEANARNSRHYGGKPALQGEPDDEGKDRINGHKEQSLLFPVVLLDVDDTIPSFEGYHGESQ